MAYLSACIFLGLLNNNFHPLIQLNVVIFLRIGVREKNLTLRLENTWYSVQINFLVDFEGQHSHPLDLGWWVFVEDQVKTDTVQWSPGLDDSNLIIFLWCPFKTRVTYQEALSTKNHCIIALKCTMCRVSQKRGRE